MSRQKLSRDYLSSHCGGCIVDFTSSLSMLKNFTFSERHRYAETSLSMAYLVTWMSQTPMN